MKNVDGLKLRYLNHSNQNIINLKNQLTYQGHNSIMMPIVVCENN